MNRESIEELARQLMFALSESEIDGLLEDFLLWEQQFTLLEEIDTGEIVEMYYPWDREIDYLREDKESDTLFLTEVLQNAAKVTDDMIVVAKVGQR